MQNLRTISRTITLSSLLALSVISVSASAGKHEQAVEAIAQARGKIEAGDKVGTNNQAPELQSQARVELATAESLLARGKKDDAIATAHHASSLADQAIVVADNRKASAERDQRLKAQSVAIDAQQSAAIANVRAETAQQAVVNANACADVAQQSAALANARADTAQTATNAQIDAMSKVMHQAPTTTTVAIVEKEAVRTSAPVRRVQRRVVHKHHSTMRVRKTTTVTTTNR